MRRLAYLLLLIITVAIYSCNSNNSSFTITDVRSGDMGNRDSIVNRLLGQHIYVTFYDNAAKMIFNNQLPEIALLKNSNGTYVGSTSNEPKVEYTLTVTQGTFSITQIQLSFTASKHDYSVNTMLIPMDQHTYVTAKKD